MTTPRKPNNFIRGTRLAEQTKAYNDALCLLERYPFQEAIERIKQKVKDKDAELEELGWVVYGNRKG